MLIQKIKIYNYQQTFGTTREKTTKGQTVLNWKHTDFAREDIDWSRFIDDMTNRYPNGAKIHCYACSDGSEAYTIALKLIQKLGLEKAKQFFPIVAKDIDKERIEKNKKGIIGLRKTIDIPEIKRCLKNTGIGLDEIIEPTQLESEKVFGTYNYEINQYKVKGILKHFVKFETADIVQDSFKKFSKDSVVLFRNAVPYLRPEQELQLVQNLRANLPPKSMFVIGGFDQSYSFIGEHLTASSFSAYDLENPMVNRGKKLKGDFTLGVPFRDNPLIAGLFVKSSDAKAYQIAKKIPKVPRLK